MLADTRPVSGAVPRTRRGPVIPTLRPAPMRVSHHLRDPRVRHPLRAPSDRHQKPPRVRPDPPYNPHNVCDAEPRGFVQQGLSARHWLRMLA